MTTLYAPPLIGKLRIEGELCVKTGLHIGGSGEAMNIGGLDKSVIRDPITQYPYLPGTSLKGKLRSILERFLNQPLNRSMQVGGQRLYRHECDTTEPWLLDNGKGSSHVGARDCPVCRMFGSTGAAKCFKEPDQESKGDNYPAKLIVRDCHLTEDSIPELKAVETGLYMTEWKFENGLDRITAAANPRQVERIPAGAKFKFELVYTIENPEQVGEDLQNIAIALAILEDDALGGHGSRGYGKVKFESLQFYYRGIEQYQQITSGSIDFSQSFFQINSTDELLGNFGRLTSAINDQRSLPGSGA